MSASLNPSDLGVMIFSAPPASLGTIDLNLSNKDNEITFQVVLQIALSGALVKNVSLDQMLTNREILNSFNQHLMWIGFKMNLESVSVEDLGKVVYHSRLISGNILRNRFHPFHLMEYMDDNYPDSFYFLLHDREHFKEVFAIKTIEGRESVVAVSFSPIQIVFTG